MATGPWPEGIPFIKGLVRYSPAQYTQEIAVTDNRDRISKVHRSRIDDQHKWGQPGGMFGVKGWKSTLYKYIPEGGQQWVGNIAVWSGSNFQMNRGWKRAYPNGTIFVDVLSKDGVIFEKRIREKQNGSWEQYVSFKNTAARPSGYNGLKQRCAFCHNDRDGPGTGGYATGLVPGGDLTISDPLPFE